MKQTMKQKRNQMGYQMLCSVHSYINWVLPLSRDNSEARGIVQEKKMEFNDVEFTPAWAYADKWENMRKAFKESFEA